MIGQSRAFRVPLLRPTTAVAAIAAAAALSLSPALSLAWPADGGGGRGVPAWGALAAQATPRPTAAPRSRWSAVRVAKWTLLGVTVGLGYYALTQSTRADRAYSSLRHLCVDVPTSCRLSDGRYPDARAEGLYATSLRRDHRAQGGILGGQASLLGSAALFVYDLRNVRGPENIPFPGVPPVRPAPSDTSPADAGAGTTEHSRRGVLAPRPDDDGGRPNRGGAR